VITEIDHAQSAMPAGGEDAARAFYRDVLGFEESPKPNELAARGGVWFECNGVRLHLGVDPDFRAAKKAHPALRCDDYEALLDRIEAAGYGVVEDALLFEARPHSYVTDPFGNRIELIPE
jgi:catechol 2,3-dioxygenase-like lactoylglutathione lyase family enzyme